MLLVRERIFLPLLELIIDYKQVDNVKTATEILVKRLDLTQLNMDVDGESVLYEQVNSAIALFIKAGLIFDGIESFIATIKARKLVKQSPSKITENYLNQLAKERVEKKKEKIKKKLLIKRNTKYLQKLKRVNPTYFAHIAGVVISEINNVDFLNKLKIIDGRNDGGIDGIIHLGTDKKSKFYFQAKCYNKDNTSVAPRLLREFAGALLGVEGQKGYFVTTIGYNKNVIKYVEKVRKYVDITLIDGDELVALIFKYELENKIELR